MDKIKELLTRGVEEVIVSENLKKELKSGKKIRVKFGIDPTAPYLHLGHTVPLRKLRAFQDLGHQAVLIIGDFTATIGDPTGRNELRKQITSSEVKKNMKTYLEQANKILDMKKLEIHYNSEWFDDAGILTMYELMSKISVQRAMERDDFKKRMALDMEVSVLELMYPILQGYDSVMVKADLEIGGTDQKFNLLMGRRVQRAYKMKEQNILTTRIIEGTDGVRKMSKSYDNYIALTEKPELMYGKIMSIPDDLIVKYFRALTDVPINEVEAMLKLSQTKSKKWDPRKAKGRLAYEIVKTYYNAKEALLAENKFIKIFAKGEVPDDILEYKLKNKETFVDVLINSKLVTSKSEARRAIEQGGVSIDGEKITDINLVAKPGVLKKGKRHFIKITN